MTQNTRVSIVWLLGLVVLVGGAWLVSGRGDGRPDSIPAALWTQMTPSERDAYVEGQAFAQQIADSYGIDLDEDGPDQQNQDYPQYTSETRREPMTAEQLNVELDETGRPYDAGLSAWVEEISIEAATTLTVPNGELVVMGAYDLLYPPGETEPVELQLDGERLDVVLHSEIYHDDRESLLAVEIVVRDRAVASWAHTETAYYDRGAVVTKAAINNGFVVNPEAALEGFYDDGFAAADLDGLPGEDGLMVSVAGEDGRYLMSRGFDADGVLVALVIFDQRYPWRLAFPAGTPPSDITARENEMSECLTGERDVTVQFTDGIETSRYCNTSELGGAPGD